MIYFIQAADGTGAIKIGVADYPNTRLSFIQRMSPVRLKILNIIEGGLEQERILHLHFSPFRLHGEWFEPAQELLGYIFNPIELPEISIPKPESRLSEEDIWDIINDVVARATNKKAGQHFAVGLEPHEVMVSPSK